jgi:hypothetical protein
MVFTTETSIAANGRTVQGIVSLVGTEDEQPLAWRAEGVVDGTRMAFSHHNSRAEAEANAKKWHDAYLEVHGGARKESDR